MFKYELMFMFKVTFYIFLFLNNFIKFMAKILYLSTKILKIMGFFCFIFDRIWTCFFLMVKFCKFYFLKQTMSTILSDLWKVSRWRTTDAKWWQKLTLPLASWAKKTGDLLKRFIWNFLWPEKKKITF
jgi:hypothetical protein